MVQLEQALVAESQPLVDGMCLADWEAVPGFRWDDLEHASDVILPQRLKAAGLKRLGIALEKPGWSPNVGGFGQAVLVAGAHEFHGFTRTGELLDQGDGHQLVAVEVATVGVDRGHFSSIASRLGFWRISRPSVF